MEKQLVLMLEFLAFADSRQQTNIFFNQLPFSHVRSNAVSSWDNLEGFRFTETKFPLLKPTKIVGFDETHFSTSEISNTVVAHDVHHHNLDGLMSFKGTNIKVFNEGTVLIMSYVVNLIKRLFGTSKS